MKLLNRTAISLIPLQPYADWVNSLPDELTEFDGIPSLEDFQAESRVYLLDEIDEDIDSLFSDENTWKPILENELAAWDEFGDHWFEITRENFGRCFAITLLPVVFDAAKEPLMRAELA